MLDTQSAGWEEISAGIARGLLGTGAFEPARLEHWRREHAPLERYAGWALSNDVDTILALLARGDLVVVAKAGDAYYSGTTNRVTEIQMNVQTLAAPEYRVAAQSTLMHSKLSGSIRDASNNLVPWTGGAGYSPEDFAMGQPGTAILPDGTFVVAAQVDYWGASTENNPGYLRVWHLSADLGVLGSVDIPWEPGQSYISNGVVLCSLGNGTVFMASQPPTAQIYSSDPVPIRTWILGCTGPAPAVLSTHDDTGRPGTSYGTFYGPCYTHFHAASNRVVVLARNAIQVFDAATAALVADFPVQSNNLDRQGIVPSPTDPNVVAILVSTGWYELSLGGPIPTLGAQVIPNALDEWVLAMGSPYDPSAVFVWEEDRKSVV